MQRLEASARAAADIPAKVRRNPARTAGLAAGTAFVVLGGPQRIYRRARRQIFGPGADLPKSMLPKDIEKTLRKLGSDGDKVRPTLEREFAHYLDSRAKVRRERDVLELGTEIAGNVLKPLSARFGKQLASRLFEPDSPGFDEAMAKVRARYAAQASGGAAAVEAAAAGEPLAPVAASAKSGAASAAKGAKAGR
jgi:hypothetical protein